ncbi:hypothetical protein L1987_11221 [Smallanthus sonchifolius]|uniref:Uncharacterized protein n=1 Tax=Smallanthus sonchifolius TaxID=185202 RepID=A0ACB9JB93_9ASTR|nr:hypothetical protein L1987_11221 [Smallanthus sonchifolius]
MDIERAEQEEQNQEENSKADGSDEKPNEQKSEKNNKQNAGTMVLGVYLHCQGCVETVVKSLRGFDEEATGEEAREETRDTEVVLKMHLHCEGCAKDVKHCIHKMEGVQTVNADMDKALVTVNGTFDPKNLVAYIIKKSGRHAEIVNPKNNKKNKKDGEQKEEHEKNEKKEKDAKSPGSAYPNVPPGLIYAQ